MLNNFSIDYRRETEWKRKFFIFPRPLETEYTINTRYSNAVIKYSKFFTTLECRRKAVVGPCGYICIYRLPGSTWDSPTYGG